MSLDTTIGDLPVDPPAYDTADSDACDSGDGHEDTGVETAFCGFPEDEPAPGTCRREGRDYIEGGECTGYSECGWDLCPHGRCERCDERCSECARLVGAGAFS